MKTLIIILLILFGCLIGILINYLADVLPQTRKLGRVKCKQCNRIYSWKEYLLLKKCLDCESRRSIRFWVVLFLAPAAAIVLYFLSSPGFRLFNQSIIDRLFWIGNDHGY